MKNKIKIAVVGIGLMGSQHLKALSVSKKLNKEFIDIYQAIEVKEGMIISEIFEKKGEKFFRSEERKEIQVGFSGRWSCDSCWEWIENEISDGQNNVELSLEAKTILLFSPVPK